jgi:hypothetical protein
MVSIAVVLRLRDTGEAIGVQQYRLHRRSKHLDTPMLECWEGPSQVRSIPGQM